MAGLANESFAGQAVWGSQHRGIARAERERGEGPSARLQADPDSPERTSQVAHSGHEHRISQEVRPSRDQFPLEVPAIHSARAETDRGTTRWRERGGTGRVSRAGDDVEVVQFLLSGSQRANVGFICGQGQGEEEGFREGGEERTLADERARHMG